MVDRISLSFGIESKLDIGSILGSSDLIPKNELHVQGGTDYAKKLNGIGDKVSVALIAKADERCRCPDYTIGYSKDVKVVFTDDDQEKPLMINDGMLQRAVEQFTDNDVYSSYEIEVLSPPRGISEFLRGRRILNPYATPDS